MQAHEPTAPHADTVLAPFRYPAFRVLWAVALMANLAMWMHDVAAAWVMSTLTADPLWIGLVQTAAMLPVFLLGIPGGAMADTLDRKKLLQLTQLGAIGSAALLTAVAVLDQLSPAVLLAMTFANGCMLALRLPVMAAVVPEAVPSAHWPSAMALSAVTMNVSRILGPIAAGLLLVQAGPVWVFAFNAVVSVVSLAVLSRWRPGKRLDPLGPESLGAAMRVGLQFVRHSGPLRGVLWRMGVFFLCSAALMALLPLVARALPQGGARTFTWLIAAMGLGALAATALLPRIRQWGTSDALVLGGSLTQALTLVAMTQASALWMALASMVLAGAAWIVTGNTLLVASQQGLPGWVRARGMSISQVIVMGASAAGAALWGQVASWTQVQGSLAIAALCLVVGMVWVVRRFPAAAITQDLRLQRVEERPVARLSSLPGRVVMSIEYCVDPAQVDAFKALMQGEVRSNRMRHGSLSWDLLQDLQDPCRFQETVVDRSWTDHLRHFDRLSASDLDLRERRLAFHQGDAVPQVRRFLVTSTATEARPASPESV